MRSDDGARTTSRSSAATRVRYRLPRRPFRAVGSLPFGATTALLRHLLDDPGSGLERADLVVQWEVARKRAAHAAHHDALRRRGRPGGPSRPAGGYPPTAFRPVPAVDAAVLRVARRAPPLLPGHLAPAYGAFVRAPLEVASPARDGAGVDRAGRLPPHRGGGGASRRPAPDAHVSPRGLALDKTDGEPVWFSAWDQLRRCRRWSARCCPTAGGRGDPRRRASGAGAAPLRAGDGRRRRRRRRRSGTAPSRTGCGRARRGPRCHAP